MPVYPITMSDELYSLAKRESDKRDITIAEVIRGCMRNELCSPPVVERLGALDCRITNVEKLCLSMRELQDEFLKNFGAINHVLISVKDGLFAVGKAVQELSNSPPHAEGAIPVTLKRLTKPKKVKHIPKR